MIKIGIIGNFLKTASILSEMLNQNNKTTKIVNYNQFFNIIQNQYDFLLIGISTPYTSSKYINKLKLNILLINNSNETLNLTSPPLLTEQNGILLINSDKTNNIKIEKAPPAYIITFGFSSKNTITLSSVKQGTYNTFQLCIQRSIKTLTNKTIYEQELPINTKYHDILPTLASIIILILCDIANKQTPISILYVNQNYEICKNKK